MIKDVDSAYKHTIDVINYLKKHGVEILVKQKELDANKNECLDHNMLHFSNWVNIQFKVKDSLECEKVSFARRYLAINGVSFDTGACCGIMDWKLDWSFRFCGIEESKELEDFDDVMERMALKRH